jgi:hypothetical protein
MMEILIVLIIIVALFIAYWLNYSHSNEIWKRGRDKVLLQQAGTMAVEQIGRDIRFGSRASIAGSQLTIERYDQEDSVFVDVREYSLSSNQLQMDGSPLVPEKCASLLFTYGPDDDTTEVRFVITLEDKWANQATFRGSAFMRNIAQD